MALAFQNKLQRSSDRRIINGLETRPGEFPWAAAIGMDGIFFCGGAVINSQFVLTAAHCLLTRDSPIETLAVHIGDYDLTIENETEHVIRGVRRVLFHSHFHPFLLANDIALLHLSSPVQFNIFIQPICLPQSGTIQLIRNELALPSVPA
ncbi:hypothetical protein J6590_027490 [Homalodisca vitripennis]|nr:hypothetical protein J6590_027490 [Homalodisca vitripennis]